ncbi:hypothetical protein D3C71_1110440 [compost metagenome]
MPGERRQDAGIDATGKQRAARIDIEHAGTGAAVAQSEVAVEGELAVVGQPDVFPVGEARDSIGLDVAHRQAVIAHATIEHRQRAQVRGIEVGERGAVIAFAKIHRAVHHAAIVPIHTVVADTQTHLTAHRAAADGHRIITATNDDVAADITVGQDDRVIAKAGDEIAVDGAPGHVEGVVFQLHVDAADAATGHLGVVAVVEATDDAAAGHAEAVRPIALQKRAKRATGHQERIFTKALLHGAGNGAVADLHLVLSVALVHRRQCAATEQQHVIAGALRGRPRNRTAQHLQTVIAGALRQRAGDVAARAHDRRIVARALIHAARNHAGHIDQIIAIAQQRRATQSAIDDHRLRARGAHDIRRTAALLLQDIADLQRDAVAHVHAGGFQRGTGNQRSAVDRRRACHAGGAAEGQYTRTCLFQRATAGDRAGIVAVVGLCEAHQAIVGHRRRQALRACFERAGRIDVHLSGVIDVVAGERQRALIDIRHGHAGDRARQRPLARVVLGQRFKADKIPGQGRITGATQEDRIGTRAATEVAGDRRAGIQAQRVVAACQ